MALNLAILVALAGIAWKLHFQWVGARERDATVIDVVLKSAHIPPPPPVPMVKPVAPANYVEVAQKMLFAADRNPNVILDPVVPPKPKPVPPFPTVHGVMIWGDVPPTIILSESSQEQKSYRVGEKIGDFTIAKITNEEVTFAWDGKEFRKKLDDLIDNTPPPAQMAAPQKHVAQSSGVQGSSLSQQDKQGPGVDIGGDMKGCQPGDSSPAGTVADGMKKIVMATPFGSSCRWEKVR